MDNDWLAESKSAQVDPVKVICPCGCQSVGALRRKVMNDGKRHVRMCSCRRCIGSRNRIGGLDKQRVARRAFGVPEPRMAALGANEEQWRHPLFRCEVKSGQLARSVATQYNKGEKQAERNRAIGDARPLAFLLMPADWGGEGLVVLRLTAWNREIVPRLATENQT